MLFTGYSRHATPTELLRSISEPEKRELIAALQLTNAHLMPAWTANAIGYGNYWTSRQFTKASIDHFMPPVPQGEEKAAQTPEDHEAMLRLNLAMHRSLNKKAT